MSRKRFNVTKQGKYGIKNVYLKMVKKETKECFNRLCKYHEPCTEDFDCLSNYCNRSEKICTYPHMC